MASDKLKKTRILQILFGVILIISIALISVSLKKLKSTEYGVAYDKWAKTLADAAEQGGLHNGPPGFKFIKFPSTQINAELNGTCVSRDGLRVVFDVTYQYKIAEEAITDAIIKYRNFEKWGKIVEAAGSSAIQHTCSEYNITNFQSKRGAIQESMLTNLRIKLEGVSKNSNITSVEDADIVTTEDGVHALAVSLQLRDVELPAEYRTAVAEKQAAEEDIILARNQKTQETTKAQTELLAANEEARKIKNTAENVANVTLKQAELKAQETLYALDREASTLMDVRTSFNLTSAGLIAYTQNQLYESMDKLRVKSVEPAKKVGGDEL